MLRPKSGRPARRTVRRKAVNILVAYDGSQQARRALDWAARFPRDSTVGVISVALSLEATAKILDAVDPTSGIDMHRYQLEEAAAILGELGVTAEKLLRVGNPAEEIINTAEEGEFDLIIVGIKGMSAVKRFLIGSVADRVVRHATVPVLVA